MRYIAKIILGSLIFAGVFASCIEDKGNYDYNWVQQMEVRLPELEPSDSLTVAFGTLLQLTPVFYDKTTGMEVNVDMDDYSFSWDALAKGVTLKSRRIHLSGEFDLNANIVLPMGSDFHSVTLSVTNKQTNQIYLARFYMRVTGDIASGYFFLKEDESRNVEIDIYGYTPQGEGKLIENFIAGSGMPPAGEGANGIIFDKPNSRILFATGDTFTWLTSPDLMHYEIFTISLVLVPANYNTFTAMLRLGKGETASATSRNILMFTPDKGVVNMGQDPVCFPNFAYLDGRPAPVATMIGGYREQSFVVYWAEADKRLCWASVFKIGLAETSKSLTLIDDEIGRPLADCLYLGGCENLSRAAIAIVKDIDGNYWQVTFEEIIVEAWMVVVPTLYGAGVTSVRKLEGTASLGTVNHWINSHEKGYVYASTDNGLYTYVESQLGGTADPGWKKVAITNMQGAAVTIDDPVSFVHFENDGKNYMYVFTYSEANGGTLYLLRPGTVGEVVVMVDKITGLGNAKKMCSWWG